MIRPLASPTHARALLLSALALATAAPLLWAAWFEHGVFWPDEVLQTLEQGHRFAFGYGLVPWEFRDGVRSWFIPGGIGLLMKLGAAAGVHTGLGLARCVKIAFALGTVAGGYATMRLAERLGGWVAAALAGALYASSPLLVYFGSRCFTDTASIPFVAFGAWMLSTPRDSARRGVRMAAAGALLGLAAVVRHQNGLIVATALGALVAARDWRGVRAFAPGALCAVALGGLLDWATWGAPFASLVRYVRFNVNAGASPGWGDEPLTYYATTYYAAVGWPIVLVGVGMIAAAPRARALVALVVVYVAAHELIRLKQARLLLPVLPIAIAVGAAGIVLLLKRFTAKREHAAWWVVGVLSAAAVATSAQKLARATFASMGYLGKGETPAWHFDELPSLLFSRVGARTDTCGVIYFGRSGRDWDHTGGFSYLHRDVPLFHSRDGSLAAYANYIVGPRGVRLPPGYSQVDTLDTYALYRRDGACTPAPGWYSRDSER